MANNGTFTKLNTLEFPNSTYSIPFQHNTTLNHGQLVPMDCFRCSPNEEINYHNLSFRLIMAPIKAVADQIEWHLRAYWVPDRLVWSHTKEFYGENKASKGYDLTEREIPHITEDSLQFIDSSDDYDYAGNKAAIDVSLGKYLGKPLNMIDDFAINSNGINDGGAQDLKISVLKERGYYLIYNHYFRHPFLQDPYVIFTDDTGKIALHGSDQLYVDSPLLYVSKCFDYFTTALLDPTPFKVTIPLGTNAPVIPAGSGLTSLHYGSSAGPIVFGTGSSLSPALASGTIGTSSGSAKLVNTTAATGANITATNLVADLSNAIAPTVDSLKTALAMDTFFLRSNYSGGRFDLEMKLHYGAEVDELEIQEPLPLGHLKGYVNISEILQTTGAADAATASLGDQGAYSTTVVKGRSLFTRRFKEPGHVFVLFYTRQANQSYSQGFLREDMKMTRFEFFTSELAGISSQEIKKDEIFAVADPTNLFGTQEAWAEHRMRTSDRNSGLMDPNVSTLGQIWTLGNMFTSEPTLSEDFILENRNNISRILKTTDTGPDFKLFYYVRYRDNNEVPVNPESLLKAPFSF